MSEMPEWRRSSFCGEAACAEVKIEGDTVSLRSTTKPDATVELTRDEWEVLKAAIRNGEF